ncbi:FkbM family methyltransferase [Microcoleus sp. FACHB-1515]|uniref:FkbM family methyltransferase n=1 Tax=Cyanophyceae TaxID=3028117 RepID=UPI0016851537|nr:FkbM family methyltransferase [Microcoleus sp. FACHB-1515]MBD2088944.1 FkbM family methyltransferase [Microcoleus sp. FACHB-1515]
MPIFLPHLKQQGFLETLQMTVCNVGSRKLNASDDYANRGWEIFAPNLTIYGFDADADACEAANADLEERQISWREIHLPIALSNAIGESTLYVTRSPMCSSLYPPNEIFLQRFAGLIELVGLDFSVELETTTLDAFCAAEAIEAIDFLQIDVQGADLLVLQGATDLLDRSVLAVQIEVEFAPLYHNQPLFADVDAFLRNQGFSLFDLAQARRPRPISPIHGRTQLLWGDAFYFRDLLADSAPPPFKTPANLFKLACIADVMGFPDYALELLVHLVQQDGNHDYNCADAIATSLQQFPQLDLNNLPAIAAIRSALSPSTLKTLALDRE